MALQSENIQTRTVIEKLAASDHSFTSRDLHLLHLLVEDHDDE